MGDVADDAFDGALADQAIVDAMHRAGCRRCPYCPDDDECPICHDLGWLDADGRPCEP